jgi:hypothetical protein
MGWRGRANAARPDGREHSYTSACAIWGPTMCAEGEQIHHQCLRKSFVVVEFATLLCFGNDAGEGVRPRLADFTLQGQHLSFVSLMRALSSPISAWPCFGLLLPFVERTHDLVGAGAGCRRGRDASRPEDLLASIEYVAGDTTKKPRLAPKVIDTVSVLVKSIVRRHIRQFEIRVFRPPPKDLGNWLLPFTRLLEPLFFDFLEDLVEAPLLDRRSQYC